MLESIFSRLCNQTLRTTTMTAFGDFVDSIQSMLTKPLGISFGAQVDFRSIDLRCKFSRIRFKFGICNNVVEIVCKTPVMSQNVGEYFFVPFLNTNFEIFRFLDDSKYVNFIFFLDLTYQYKAAIITINVCVRWYLDMLTPILASLQWVLSFPL